MADQRHQTSEAARLRDRIDRGETGSKVPASDPAAAPLGTDAEAGGSPPADAAGGDQAFRPPPDDPPVAADSRSLRGGRSPALWIGAAGIACLVVLVAVAALG
jgi:hypothetical protein